MNINIVSVTLPKGAQNNPRVDAALAALDRDISRFFEFNGDRPVYVHAEWRGRYYVVRARYVVENSGGQHMTIGSRCS